MRAKVLASVLVFASSLSLLADTISQWNFNSSPPDGSTSTGTLNPSLGSGNASYVGGATNASSGGEFAAGTGQDLASDNSAWNTSKYPTVSNANKTAGIRFDSSTSGYTNIIISWYQRHSATASRYWRAQYTLDGVSFSDATLVAIYVDSVFTNKIVNLSAVPGAANNPSFGFRIVSEFESSATGSGSDGYVPTDATQTYNGSSGTVRFDLVTISGTLLPGGNMPPTISSVSNQVIRVNQSTGPLALTVLDAEDPATNLVLSATSSDPSVIPPANIVFSGTSSRTVNVSAGAQSGSSTITLWVTDTGAKSNSSTFTVTVLPANTAPLISAISPTNTLLNTAISIPFTVSDAETPASSLTVSALSANPALVSTNQIVFGGSGSNRTVTVTPMAGQAGVAPITITVSDGSNNASAAFGVIIRPSANVLIFDPFDYSDGPIDAESGFVWGNQSGPAGECLATNGQLQVTAAQTEDIAVRLPGGPYQKNSGTVLYCSFKATFVTLPKTTPDYFAAYVASGSQVGRIYVGQNTNAPAGFFRLSVANGSSTNTVLSNNLNTNFSHTIVTRYNVDTAVTTLWLNPSAETDPGVTASDFKDPLPVSLFEFRQGSGLGATIMIDDLRLGLSFASVTGPINNTPPAIPLNFQRLGNNLVLSWTNPAFALQASPSTMAAFTNIPAASSPYTNPMTGASRFFRLKQN